MSLFREVVMPSWLSGSAIEIRPEISETLSEHLQRGLNGWLGIFQESVARDRRTSGTIRSGDHFWKR